MPLVACPTCKTTLKIPDGSAGNVKCPKCATIFALAVKPAAAPAFEVVDNSPPAPRPAGVAGGGRPPASTSPAPPPPPPSAKAAAAEDFDFEVVDEPRKKRRRDDYDDDYDDRPRSSRRDEDDDYDRPRRASSRRRRDDDEDDDYYDRRPGGSKAAAMGNARVGMLLLSISSWLYFATFCIFALGILIMWASSGESSAPRSGRGDYDSGPSYDWVFVVIGILGMANWIVAAIGLGFCIAGPKRCRGTTITATVLAGVHIVLTAVCYNMVTTSIFGAARGLGFGSSPGWLLVGSTIPWLNMFLPMLVYGSKEITGEFMVLMLAGACEVARLIFVLLTIKALAHASRNHDAAEKSTVGVIVASIVVGVAAVVILFLVVLVEQKAFKSFSTVQNLGMGVLFLISLGYVAMTLFPALASTSAQKSLGRRAR